MSCPELNCECVANISQCYQIVLEKIQNKLMRLLALKILSHKWPGRFWNKEFQESFKYFSKHIELPGH